MSNTYISAFNFNNGTSLVSATGHDGYAHALFTGATVNATIEALATSATTQALINLEGSVDDSLVMAVGNAQIAIDGATLSATSLQTVGANAEIGVTGGGLATAIDTTVVKGSYIYDDGTLTFGDSLAQPKVTFLAYGTDAAGGALTLSNTTLGAGDGLFADRSAAIFVIAAPDGTTTFSAGTVVGATSNSTIEIDGGVANSGVMAALAVSRDSVNADIIINGGTAGSFLNAKHALVEAEAISGYNGDANVIISAGGSAVNDGTMLAVAGVGHRDDAQLSVTADTFTNDKGAKVAEIAQADASASLNILGSSGVTNAGSITGTASHDSFSNDVEVETEGGPIVNSRTISVAATTSSSEGLLISDHNVSGGSLTNAKGASIKASATTGSTVNVNIDIDSSGILANSGTMSFAASKNSDLTVNHFEAGAVVNTGTIDMTASNNAYGRIDNFNIGASGGALTNSGGKIEVHATAGSTAYIVGSFISGGTAGGDLTNDGGTMQAVAVMSSHAEEDWTMNGGATNGSGNLSNTKTMAASAGDNSFAEFLVEDFAFGTNSGTIAATASNTGEAFVELEDGRAFTNNNVVTAAATANGFAETTITVAGSGGSDANITNTSIMKAVGNGPGTAHLTLSANSTSGAGVVNAGTITAMANGGFADVSIEATGNYSSIGNTGTLGAIAAGGTAYLNLEAFDTSNTITNTTTIEAVANGGTAYVQLGGGGFTGAVVNNSGGTLLARAPAGSAVIDLGEHEAKVFGGTLTTVGAHAYLGVFENDTASATGVTITAKSHIVGWNRGELDLTNLASSISAGTLVQAAKDGTVNITGKLSNSGTIEALANNRFGDGTVNINAGSGASTITNSGTIEAIATSGNDDDAEISMSAGTVTNARKGTIEVLATAESYGTSASANFVNIGGTSIINSGTILASAKDSSRDAVTVNGGTVTNAATGRIEAIATDQSDAEAYVYGSTTNAGLIGAQGDADSEASVFLSGLVNNSGGIIEAVGNAAIYLGDDGDNSAIVTSGTLQTVGRDAAALVTDTGAATLNTVYIAPDSLVLANNGGVLTLQGGTVIGNDKKGTKAATVDAYEGDGEIVVSGTIYNFGALIAGGGADGSGNGGTVTIATGATLSGPGGIGWVDVDEFGIVSVQSGGTANVSFDDVTSGTLVIEDGVGSSTVFGGTVAGWGGVGGQLPGQIIELDNGDGANSGDYTATYSRTFSATNPNQDIGTLTVTSGGSTAAVITLEGNYVSGATFTFFNDSGNIGIFDPPGPATVASTPVTLASIANPPPSLINTAGASNVALLGNYMASMFAATEGGVTPTGSEGAHNQTSLAAAHHA